MPPGGAYTPDVVPGDRPLADPGMRFLARFLDGLIVGLVFGLIFSAIVLSDGDSAGFGGIGADASFGRVYLLALLGMVAGFYRGFTDGQWATAFPPQVEISQRTMDRGKDRYTIYCTPCHGQDGKGAGMIHNRAMAVGAAATGWVQPSDLSQAAFITQPHGLIFNTITHGIRNMPPYGSIIPEQDRWAIILYLRALQRSKAATYS